MKAEHCSFSLSWFALMLLLLPVLVGCDQLSGALGVETSSRKEARLEAEGKAVGGGCRQSGRAIEDCYSIYTWVPKEAVFSGWLDMDAYMRENNLDTIPPLLPPAPPDSGKKKKKAAESTGDADNTSESAVEAPVGPVPIPLPLSPSGAAAIPPVNAIPVPNTQGAPLPTEVPDTSS
ncbi:MAG: hypothetical protein FWG81_01985 [Betaproteobacteria bacterium]|nr:hypothetical protein [Betaproteobacteria bacterium]